jgi:gamma-glutamylcyclotransferase (GGCT)/AIG2-like uncharacterized protein YtfP
MLQAAEMRLISYGTLRPGESNHHVVSAMPGRWVRGKVQGTIDTRGHYPRFRRVANGHWINVQVFLSRALPVHWRRLDRFEGPDYRRVAVPVRIGTVMARGYIYESAKR